jgi:tripartite ATP-independent transporter DctP family solute receptor
MKRRKHSLGLIALTVTVALGFVLPTTGFSKVVMKCGSISPTQHPEFAGLKIFKKVVEEKTNGEIEVQLFPGGQLGAHRAMTEQVQSGAIQMALIGSAALSMFVPQAIITDLPFAFPNRRVLYEVLDSEIKEKVFSYFPPKGFKALEWSENDFRDITNSKRVIKRPEDLKGLKLRVMESPLYLDAFKALGAEAVPMAMTEVYSALQQGVIDGQENALWFSMMMKLCEVNKFVTISGHTFTGTVEIVNLDFWNRLSKRNQDILTEAAHESLLVSRGNFPLLRAEALEKARSMGVQVYELTPKEKEVFKVALKSVWAKCRETVGADLYDPFVAKIGEVTKNIEEASRVKK